MKKHTPEIASGGQIHPCVKCGLNPTPEGHDGCLGTLQGDVMNACCGHGYSGIAYIQYWNGDRISGDRAINEQKRLIIKRDLLIQKESSND